MSQPTIESICDEVEQALETALTSAEVLQLQKHVTGKKSPIKKLFGQLRSLTPEEKKSKAQEINQLQQSLTAQINVKLSALQQAELDARLQQEWVDLTMPGTASRYGRRHPLTIVERQCLEVLRQLGFEVVDGPEVEDAFHNFDALNIPEHHPARDMQDTFWVTGGLLLRSHTTTVQARVLGQQQKLPKDQRTLPLKVASLGRVYRNETVDATHLAMFHQFEGIWIEEGLTFAHLKGILAFIARSIYGEQPIRFKPKFYPYTEPSVGVDLQCATCTGEGCGTCHGAGWITILGAGMIHPKVFETFGFDPQRVSGIAFGLGTTRMAAQYVQAPAVKPLYDQELSLLQAMHRGEQ